jgi:hypothetical protein
MRAPWHYTWACDDDVSGTRYLGVGLRGRWVGFSLRVSALHKIAYSKAAQKAPSCSEAPVCFAARRGAPCLAVPWMQRVV